MDTHTHGHAEPVLQSHRWRTVDNSAAYLAPHLRPGLDVLDVGCGPGTVTVDLARRVAPGRVVGVDVSAAPLDEARELAAREGVEVRFEVGDVYRLEAEDAAYDVVHAHQVLQHLTDPVAALREMARVCRPGGLVAVRDVDYAATTWWPPDPALDQWLDLYRRVARRNGAEPDAGRRLVAWAHAAGLRDLTASAGTYCYASPAERAWWGEALGRAGDRVGLRRAGPRLRPRRPGRARRGRGGVAALGGVRRRLVRHAPRGAARPRMTPLVPPGGRAARGRGRDAHAGWRLPPRR